MAVTAANYGKGTGLKSGGKNEAVLRGKAKPTKNGKEVSDRDVTAAVVSNRSAEAAREEERKKLETAQKTVSSLNASAERSGSTVRYEIKQDKETGSVSVVTTTRQQQPTAPRSTAMNTGGVTQVPGLQTQTLTPTARQEQTFTPRPSVEPVASSNQGTVFRSNEGRLFTEVATTPEGTLLRTASQPEVKLSNRQQPGGTSGFATPGLFIGSGRRKDLVQFGEFVESKKGTLVPESAKETSKLLQGITLRQPVGSSEKGLLYGESNTADRILGSAVRSAGGVLEAGNVIVDASPATVGKNIQQFGYNPKAYVAENVVIPSEGGAFLGAGSELIAKGTPVVAEFIGSNAKGVRFLAEKTTLAKIGSATEKTLVGAGAVSLGAEVVARGEDQKPDIVFGAAGAVAGAAPKPKIGIENAEFYGGTPRFNRANRLGLATANKPTSKAEIRKQSYNQQYNPNAITKGTDYLKVRNPTTGELRTYLRQAGKEKEFVLQKDVFVTKDISNGVYREQGIKAVTRRGGKEPDTYYREVSVKTPKGREVETLIQKGGDQYKTYNFVDRQGNPVARSESDKGFFSVPGTKTQDVQLYGTKNQVTAQFGKIDYARSVNVQNLAQPKSDKFFPQNNPSKVNPSDNGLQVPEYELTPNAPSKYSSTSLGQTQRGGAQPGRQKVYEGVRERLLAQKAARSTDFQLVEYTPPSKDVVLNRELNTAVAELSSRDNLVSVRSPEFKDVLTLSRNEYSVAQNGVIDNAKFDVKVLTALPERNKEEVKLVPAVKILPDLSINSKSTLALKAGVSPINIQGLDLAPLQEPIRIQKIDLSQNQKTKTIQEVAFNFNNPKVPESDKDERFRPVPTINFKPTKTPEKPRFILDKTFVPPPPSTPLKFSLPSINRPDTQDFLVSVGGKENKYYFELGRGSEELVRKAGALAKNTAAARITVVPLNGKANKTDIAKLLGSDFRKNKQGDYIQANSKRISTAGEKQQIPGASKSKRLTKGSTYGKALSLNKKGIPLRTARRFFT